jgi:hypothetical protein
MMPSEQIGKYEIEYAGVKLQVGDEEHAGKEWGAYVTIYGPSLNPMHRNIVFPQQRVSVDTVFPTEEAAETEAHKVAMTMLK